jgi:hypothetical protein
VSIVSLPLPLPLSHAWRRGPGHRLASGIENWDQPRHTTCSGRTVWENPTYSAYWSVFGVTCPRLQRLASSVGSEDGAIGAPEEPAGFRRTICFWRVLRQAGGTKTTDIR